MENNTEHRNHAESFNFETAVKTIVGLTYAGEETSAIDAILDYLKPMDQKDAVRVLKEVKRNLKTEPRTFKKVVTQYDKQQGANGYLTKELN